MTFVDPIFACDFYKTGHKDMYPEGTTMIYSNFTPRSNKHCSYGANEVVMFGLQGFIKEWLIDNFKTGFFDLPKQDVLVKYERRMKTSIGGNIDISHIAALHDLGYLPVEIKALPEGSLVPIKVPVLTIKNTIPEFFWVTNYLETLISAELWKPITNATTAYQYRKVFAKYAKETASPMDFVSWQGHDFSLRGLSGIDDSCSAGHLISFLGTDTIPAIDYFEKYYDGLNTFVGGSVPASEHSVMCAGGEDNEVETIRRMITKTFPSGVVSVVSDTWDFFNVVTNIAAELKEDIMNRQPNEIGLCKVVFRPDSGNPADILCGDPEAPAGSPEHKGAVECLWDVFGGTTTEFGYKVLDSRVGLIYGDSITVELSEEILQRLKEKGFASCNVVFGIGSYTYQFVTRDSFNFAVKATYAEIKGKGHEIYKNPKTDSGVKKSAKGLLRVEIENGKYVLHDQQTKKHEKGGCLETVFKDGKLVKETTINEIRTRLLSY